MKHLTLQQRYEIQTLLHFNKKQSEIALLIGKHKSVVCRELKRNSDANGKYYAENAHKASREREQLKRKKILFTDEIKAYVTLSLKNDLSPEQIKGISVKENIACVSHERIYQYVWHDKQFKGNLHLHLRNKGRRYRKRGSLKDNRGIIKNRVDISQRPAIVDEKQRFGDLEIDTMIGKNHKGVLLTINDRATGIVLIRKLKDKDANALYLKTVQALRPLRYLLHTITSDNGKEFACHEKISLLLSIQMYFARPYHSWERGANENLNGLIRQYFPKGCDFTSITPRQISRVQDILNNRPRKRFNFDTPLERFEQLTNINPVALVG